MSSLKRKKRPFFSSKRRVWLGVLALVTTVQLGGLYGVDQFLRVPAITAAAKTPEIKTVKESAIPADAAQVTFNPDRRFAAYISADGELVLLDSEGEKYRDKVGNVTFLQWLGDTDTLFYLTQGSNLSGYLLRIHSPVPTRIHTWTGHRREIINTYFSPYLEFLYMEFRKGDVTEVYKYDAVDGISRLPLGDVRIDHIEYDDKLDVMKLTTDSGEVWRYEHDRLYRPDSGQEGDNGQARPRRNSGADYPSGSGENEE
ncbi:hypothetical protein ACI7RC_23825 [Brevibacillus sp. B_LB10_24]|uniref:hypothetical protein n=1 Tax=Brevibacillus sp. B_LB10_24 TaxID=3380645 RepID=UPI0038BA60DD